MAPFDITVVLRPKTMQLIWPDDGLLHVTDFPAADAAPPVE
jgi:hypothetical protein